MAVKELFGANLAHYRTEKGLTQAQLGEMVDLTQDMVSLLERGESGTSFAKIDLFCEVLEVPPAALFSVGLTTAPVGERSKLVEKIHITLSHMNSATLAKAQDILKALAK